MFEQIAINLFFDRAVREHLSLRILGAVVVGAVLVALALVSWTWVWAWVGLLIAAEIGVRVWRRLVFLRAETPAQLKRAVLQMLGWGAVLAGLWAAPALATYHQGQVGAMVATALSAAVLLVICAQHNLTPIMFYTSAAVPGGALVLTLVSAQGVPHGWPMWALSVAVLANVKNLHRANAETFKDLVVGKLDVERANEQLTLALTEAQQASAAKSTFLATMSHELRTPLNGIIGMADALALRELDRATEESVAVIGKSGRALLAILNDVLDISRIEAGRLKLQVETFDLPELVGEVGNLFTVATRDKGLSLRIDTREAAGACLGDAARVRQIVTNLVANAVKFTSAGEVEVRAVRLAADQVRIAVRDTGIGMSPETLAQLFTRFTQADGSITRQYGGTGLGLAISRELTELMGGTITAESQAGEGSTISVLLPLAAVETAAQPAPRPAAPPPPPSTGESDRPVRVLCAEDNATNQLVLRTLLEQLGCDCVMADDGQAALELWRSGGWDVVLMDMQMPVMDGLTAIRILRAEEAETGRPRTPVVAVTADAMSDQVARQLAAGADLHLSKPIQAVALLGALEAALSPAAEAAGRAGSEQAA